MLKASDFRFMRAAKPSTLVDYSALKYLLIHWLCSSREQRSTHWYISYGTPKSENVLVSIPAMRLWRRTEYLIGHWLWSVAERSRETVGGSFWL